MFFVLQEFDGDITRNGARVPTFDPSGAFWVYGRCVRELFADFFWLVEKFAIFWDLIMKNRNSCWDLNPLKAVHRGSTFGYLGAISCWLTVQTLPAAFIGAEYLPRSDTQDWYWGTEDIKSATLHTKVTNVIDLTKLSIIFKSLLKV